MFTITVPISVRLALCVLVALLASFPSMASGQRKKGKSTTPLRPIRLAVFEVDILKGVEAQPKAVTDQIVTLLSTLQKVTLVDREQLQKVANEQKIALSGLVDSRSAVKLGKFVSANYVVVGRASKIGQTYYLVLKFIEVETTVQTTIATKAPTEKGFDAVLERMAKELKAKVRKLQKPAVSADDKVLAKLRKLVKPLSGKTFLVAVDERHINRPLQDPAAQMAIVQRLKSLGFTAISPKAPVDGWKKTLLQKGRYGKQKVDYLVEGEGTSAFAARMHGLTSCRARVELRIIRLPGRQVTVTDRGVAAGVDLVEALAAKTALEKAGSMACDATIERLVKELKKSKKQK